MDVNTKNLDDSGIHRQGGMERCSARTGWIVLRKDDQPPAEMVFVSYSGGVTDQRPASAGATGYRSVGNDARPDDGSVKSARPLESETARTYYYDVEKNLVMAVSK